VREAIPLTTASEFQKKGNGLTIFSPHLSAQERQEAEEVLNSVPPHVMDLFYTLGGVAIFTEYSLVEALPAYATAKDEDKYPYYNVYVGLYRGGEKRVFMTFSVANIEERRQGPVITGYRPIHDSKYRVFHHEIGHFIDDVIGEHGSPFIEFGQIKFSDRQEFVRRITEDLNALAASNRGQAELSWRSYFLPKEHNGVPLYGQKDNAGDIRGEVFAELWAEVHGHGVYRLREYFPRTYELVNALNNDLKFLAGNNKSRQCRYEGYTPGGGN